MAADFPIFIDTNLDTYLVMTVSALNTVSDLKREIEKEHQLCFPDVGKIAVQSVKVERNGHLYHFPGSLLVKSVFHGVQGDWFLSLDVSVLEEHDEDLHSQNLLTVGGIDNNNSVDVAEDSLNGSPRQGIDTGKRTEIPQEFAIIKNNTSKHEIVVQHNMEIEEASLTDIVENKKRKRENIIKGNASDMKASKLEVTPGHYSQSNEKNENLPLDFFCTIPGKDVNSSGKKKKKKKNPRNQHNEVVAVQSGTDVREENIIVMTGINNNSSGGKPFTECVSRQGDQRVRPSQPCISNMEANHIDSTTEVWRPDTALSAVDADFTKSPADNIEGKNGISVGAMFEFKMPRNSKDDIVSGVEGNPFLIQKEPNSLQMSTELSRIQNSSTVQVQQVGEERSLTQKNDSERMQAKTCKSPGKGETEVNKLKVASEMLDHDGIVALKSAKRRKTKDLVRETLVSSDRENAKRSESEISQVEPQEASFRKQLSNKAKTEESKLSKTSGKEVLKTNTENTITHLNAENSQKEGIVGNEVVFLQQTSITEANTENREKRERKKSNKKQKSSKQNCTDFQAEDQMVGHQNFTSTANGKREEATASSLSKSKILEEPVSKDQTNRSELESEKFGVEIFVPDELYLKPGNPTKVQSETVGNTHERMPTEAKANLTCNAPVIGSEAEDNNPTGRSTEGNKTKSLDHMPNQCQHENDASFELPVDKNNKNRGDDERVSSLQVSLTLSNVENKEEIVRRKSKIKQKSLAENGTDVQAEDQNAVHRKKIPATIDKREVVASSNQSKSKKLEKPAFKDHLNGTELETGTAQSNQESAYCTKVHLEAVENTESNLNGNARVVGLQDKANNPMESSTQGSRNNFKNHLTKQHQHKVDSSGEILVEKNNRNRDHDPKVKEKKKKINSHTGGDSSALQDELKSNDEQGIVGKSHHGDSITIAHQGSLVKKNSEYSMLKHEKRLPKASGKNRTSHKHLSEHYHRGNGMASGKNNGKAANISEGRNGSSAAPRSIFIDGSSESSEDEGEHAISDAITKTPLDYAVSSDSDGESNTNLTSLQDGVKTPEGKKTGGRSTKRSGSSSAKDLALDTILRSSSRYKKAKLTASQSQPEDDSELVDFVPESQGIQ